MLLHPLYTSRRLDRMSGPFSDPKATKALRIIAIIMVVPAIALAIPVGTKWPYNMRWAGAVASFGSAAACFYLVKEKRSQTARVAMDVFAWCALFAMISLQCAVMGMSSFRPGIDRYYRSWHCRSQKIAMLLCAFALIPQLVQL